MVGQSREPDIAGLRCVGGIVGVRGLVLECRGAEPDLPAVARGFNKVDIRQRGPLGQACAGSRPHLLVEGYEADVLGGPLGGVIGREGVQKERPERNRSG